MRLLDQQEGGTREGSGLEEVFVIDSKSENRDRAVESVSEARAV